MVAEESHEGVQYAVKMVTVKASAKVKLIALRVFDQFCLASSDQGAQAIHDDYTDQRLVGVTGRAGDQGQPALSAMSKLIYSSSAIVLVDMVVLIPWYNREVPGGKSC